jgi:hypothetical protein
VKNSQIDRPGRARTHDLAVQWDLRPEPSAAQAGWHSIANGSG